MANMNWTDKQKSAIYDKDTNIIVSAGAGSGKTTVLAERIKQKVLAGVKLDQLVVLTFSNAAAHEMKERIKKAILSEASIAHLGNDVDSAYITTFDSYALSIVKKFSHLLNLDKNLSIVEQSVLNIEKQRILDEILEERYQTLPEDFTKLATAFFMKDDASYKKEVIKISSALDLKYDKREYLENYINNVLENNNIINGFINKYEDYILELVAELKFIFEENIYPEIDDEKVIEKCKNLYDPLFEAVCYDDVVRYFSSFNRHVSFPKINDNFENVIKNMKKNYFDLIKSYIKKYPSMSHIKSTTLSTKPYISATISILLELEDKINEFKFKHSLFDFSDIAKLALKILIEHEDIRLELKNSLNEILVDEYQDTSDLQELFISLIENNNVYMVGDLKQSIYRFRNANPTIFKNKYDLYNSDHSKGIKIDLTDNFRSRNEVVSTINHIFNSIMTNDLGGANYQKEHKMIYGNKSYDSKLSTHSFESEILTYDYEKELGMAKHEVEIRMIASDVVNKITNKFQVVDKKSNLLRDVKLSDFAILASSSSYFQNIKDIFKEYGIDTIIHKNEQINSSILVFVLKNLLTLAIKHYSKNYDIEFNYAFASIARSFLCEYGDEYLFDIVTNKKYLQTDIMKKISMCITKIEYIPLSSLLNNLIETFNFYEKLLKIEDSQTNLIRLEYFLSLCDNLDKLNIPLQDYPNYLETLFSLDKGPEIQTSIKETDAVIIMTIHKSKGLEFPIVYLPFLYKKFNFMDLNDHFIYDNRYGIISPVFFEGIDTQVTKDLLKRDYKKDEISERIRLFYVALTRAKEKLIFIHKNCEEKNIFPLKISSFDDLIAPIENSLSKYKRSVDVSLLKDNIIPIVSQINKQENIDYSYELKSICLKEEIKEKERASKSSDDLINNTVYNNMQMGLHIHEILEYIDYDNPKIMLENENSWMKNKVLKFLDLFIFNNKEENSYYREYAFSYEEAGNIIKGIIDLVVETKDKVYIIDYKMKHVDDYLYIRQLSIYHKYISLKTKKPIEVYLYSFIDEKLSKIDVLEPQN